MVGAMGERERKVILKAQGCSPWNGDKAMLMPNQGVPSLLASTVVT